MKSIPRHIQEAVKRYDKGLRIRWSFERQQFCLERKVPTNCLLPVPAKFAKSPNGTEILVRLPEKSDKYISYNAGYMPIFFTPYLDRRLFMTLYSTDTHRFGRYYRQKLREFDELERRRQLKERKEKIDDASSEAYDRIAWATRRRSSVFDTYKNREKNLGVAA